MTPSSRQFGTERSVRFTGFEVALNPRHGNSIVSLIISNVKIRAFQSHFFSDRWSKETKTVGTRLKSTVQNSLLILTVVFFPFVSMGRRHGWISELPLRPTLQYFV